ncbi:MAG: ABC transporter ATP-binding protein/permease [Steroidobacteraceae bacterium]|nr:ABC transporter ATP-binding protein/permease [Steroidobacteraceae bacterium]
MRDLWRLFGPYWSCERRDKVRGAALLLLALTMAQVGLAVWSNYWQRALFDALEQRTTQGVLVQVAVFAVIFALSIAVTAVHLMVKRWLQLDWRAWLTEQLVGRWLEDGRHYRLQFAAGRHDNPDQRIAEDIRIATETAIALAHTLVFSLLTLAVFVDILWSVSGSIVVPGTDVHVPGYLVPLAFLYAGVGSVLGWMFGRPLMRTTNDLQTAEATFRFGLSRTREHTEAIALMHGEPLERAWSTRRFRRVVRDWDRQSLAYLGLVSFSTGYGTLLPVFPILVAAPQYIAGAMTLGVLMQAAQAFQRLTSALSWPVDSIGEIARCRASADRVLSLAADMQRLDAATPGDATPHIVIDRSSGGHLVIEDLSIAGPSGRVLLEGFNATVRRGEWVLVTGNPAVTSRFFKVLAGLWPWGRGRVALPDGNGTLFLPQRPLLPDGTLREALCYPRTTDAFNEAEARRALAQAGLEWLAPRLDDTDHWDQALPLQAQQRLGFARVLLQRPAWIFMEDASNSFDAKSEQEILEVLQRELPQAALLTISSHPGAHTLHHRTLTL